MTSSSPALLQASVYREGEGWSEPKTLSDGREEALYRFIAKMDAAGNLTIVFEHRWGNAGVSAVHLR